jgi:hypothetical protein
LLKVALSNPGVDNVVLNFGQTLSSEVVSSLIFGTIELETAGEKSTS